MAISKKIVKDNEKISIVTTNYDSKFIKHINRKGRKVHNYEQLSDDRFKRCLSQKVATIDKHIDTITYIGNNNTFNYFLTIRGINRDKLNKIIDNIRKADKSLQYVTLASWSIDMDLHYHILLDVSIQEDKLKPKLKDIDYKLKEVTDLKGLAGYFRKNLLEVSYILRHVSNEGLKYKQIEILEYARILNYSKKIKAKPIVIKNPSEEQIQEVHNNSTYIETIEYDKLKSSIQIDKFINE